MLKGGTHIFEVALTPVLEVLAILMVGGGGVKKFLHFKKKKFYFVLRGRGHKKL